MDMVSKPWVNKIARAEAKRAMPIGIPNMIRTKSRGKIQAISHII
jgi:hypothetical protein